MRVELSMYKMYNDLARAKSEALDNNYSLLSGEGMQRRKTEKNNNRAIYTRKNKTRLTKDAS